MINVFHYCFFADWLLNRRHCKQEWQGSAIVIREKINNAIQDMPPVEEITQLLSGTCKDYSVKNVLKLGRGDAPSSIFGMFICHIWLSVSPHKWDRRTHIYSQPYYHNFIGPMPPIFSPIFAAPSVYMRTSHPLFFLPAGTF